MSRAFETTIYLDECVDHNVIPLLEQRGHIVITVQEQGTDANDDEAQVRYAALRDWVILTTNRGHFHEQHRRFQARGESHGGIITVPQDDQRPDRFFLRCAMMVVWIGAAFSTPKNRLFRWTDLQQEIQRGCLLSGFSIDEIARALGREDAPH
ncbi:MAG: DUF5615 family PIN-like protein [Chloroflexota bacterium]|nr:DUF5615 family PIN-like protein [Chloroflexota bacterium]